MSGQWRVTGGEKGSECIDQNWYSANCSLRMKTMNRNADTYFNLANCLEKASCIKEANCHWRANLKLNPNSQWAEVARRK